MTEASVSSVLGYEPAAAGAVQAATGNADNSGLGSGKAPGLDGLGLDAVGVDELIGIDDELLALLSGARNRR